MANEQPELNGMLPVVSSEPPQVFDEYRLIKPLGRGRSGLVYVALDTLLERHVAIKFIPARDEALLARFLVEARAAARIQHPNVATLYRVGQLDGRAFLVWELVRGKSLGELERPVPPERLLPIAIDIVRGLATAHRRGVLHRDIKPANIMLADSGEAKLVDFGLAALLDVPSHERRPPGEAEPAPRGLPDSSVSDGKVVGTPYFMSPEAWRGDLVDARSDLYAVGLVLYELLAGEGPFRHLTVKQLRAAIHREAPRALQLAAPAVPVGLAAIVDRCLRLDRDARFATADDLLASLELLLPSRSGASVPDGNPYRGLRPYEAEHRGLFYGRARPRQLAVERLRSESMLVVVGDSGVGKSSLCAAGILPAIAEGGLEDGRRWLVGRTVPGRTPLQNVAGVLAELVGLPREQLAHALAHEPARLGRLVRGALGDDRGVLLYLDQLEELVTLAGGEAALVAEGLASCADGLPGVRVLATARSDFLSRLAGLPGLAERLPPAILLLGPMSSGDIREAIVGPATLKGARFESDELVDALVASTCAAEGSLPLLQFTLAELWDRRDRATATITSGSLASVGGVSGALAHHADAVLVALAPDERAVARALLVRLVTVDDTRARRTADELRVLSPRVPEVLEALVRGRLLVASETLEGAAYEIAHEALVGGWDTLARWLAEEAELRAARHRLETAADEWQRLGRSRDQLWSAGQLARLDGRVLESLTPREQAFVAESRRARAVARWIRRGAIGVVVVAVGATWLGATLVHRREVARAIASDLALAEQSWATARAAAAERGRTRGEALLAWDRLAPADGERAWGRMKVHTETARAGYAETAGHLERALLRDPDRADVRERYADLLLDRVLLAEAERHADERKELAARLALHDESGQRRASLDAGAELAMRIEPRDADVRVARYDGRESVALVSGEARRVPAGAWILTATAPGFAELRLPVLLERGTQEQVELRLPPSAALPEGFIYIPAGAGLFGSSEADAVRSWANAVPLHQVRTAGYLIARHETTFAQWIEFLDDVAPDEREARRPRVAGTGFRGMLELSEIAGTWQIALQPTEHLLRARWGESVRYPARTHRAEQDWRRMPVTGISYEDAVAYTRWLQRTGRLPAARLCTEHEWERAARGTDDRMYPHGNVLRADDANFDETYGKQAGGFGPDEVGSHPGSRSPLGIDDLAGNAWEWVSSSLVAGQVVARGGSYYFAAGTARLTNRELPEPSYRDLTVGLRICASYEPG